MIKKVISGGQNGVDIAGLMAAKCHGIETGGHIPYGYRTLDGNKPIYRELYNLQETASKDYPPRTHLNVFNSDFTLRIAKHWTSSGEKLTMKAITNSKRPHIDISWGAMNSSPSSCIVHIAAALEAHNVQTLNIAGNSENTWPGIFDASFAFLCKLFLHIGHKRVGGSCP